MISFGKKKKGRIVILGSGIVSIDVRVSETHDFSAKITDYPIEDGSILSDHIIKEPFTVSIDGIISDTPIGGLAIGSRSETAFEMLTSCIRDGKLVTLDTSLATYRGAISKFSVARDSSTGEALSFTATFREIVKSTVMIADKVTIESVVAQSSPSGAVNSTGSDMPTEAEGVGDRSASDRDAGQSPMSIWQEADALSDSMIIKWGL